MKSIKRGTKGESGEERKGNQERNEREVRRGTKGKPGEE
jgi:hypothetical protein